MQIFCLTIDVNAKLDRKSACVHFYSNSIEFSGDRPTARVKFYSNDK